MFIENSMRKACLLFLLDQSLERSNSLSSMWISNFSIDWLSLTSSRLSSVQTEYWNLLPESSNPPPSVTAHRIDRSLFRTFFLVTSLATSSQFGGERDQVGENITLLLERKLLDYTWNWPFSPYFSFILILIQPSIKFTLESHFVVKKVNIVVVLAHLAQGSNKVSCNLCNATATIECQIWIVVSFLLCLGKVQRCKPSKKNDSKQRMSVVSGFQYSRKKIIISHR